MLLKLYIDPSDKIAVLLYNIQTSHVENGLLNLTSTT